MNNLSQTCVEAAPTSYDSVALGNTIRLLREQLGITQTELGDSAHVSTAEISKLENGCRKKKIPIETLIKLSTCLNVSLDFLLASCLSFNKSDRERFYDYEGNEIDLYKAARNLYSADSGLLILLSSPDFLSDKETISFIKLYIKFSMGISQVASLSDIIKRMFKDFKDYCINFMDAVMTLTGDNSQKTNNAVSITVEN
jgi:transcriptional regulator with XRE-family HTH domain